MLSYLLQKDVAEAEHWVAQGRRREWGEECYQERERAWQEELEQREAEGDTLRGRSEVITRVHNEQEEVAQHHMGGAAREVFSSSTPGRCYHLGLPSLSPDFRQFTFTSCRLCTLGGDNNKVSNASYTQGTCCPIIVPWQTIPCQ